MTPDALERLTLLRRDLHRYPELSGQERETSARVVGLLSDLGADRILQGLGGYGVAAVFEGSKLGPTVAIRCELDGLPIQEISDVDYVSQNAGNGHLCGHDGHMVMVLGVAEALKRNRPSKGRVVLIFQPAEETGKGAEAFRNSPEFSDIAPDYVFSLHNLPGLNLGSVELCEGPANCASCGMKVTLVGKTSHAAAPQDGVSPAFALSGLIPKLASLSSGDDLDEQFALATITHANLGERTFGVAPGQAELWVTLRTVTDARMHRMMADAEALVRDAAASDGLACQITYDDVFEACVNHPEAVENLQTACKTHGVPCKLVQSPQKFSEDFGQFSKGAKTAMFWLGAGRTHPQLHNPDYDFPDDLIPIGTKIFLSSIQQILGGVRD